MQYYGTETQQSYIVTCAPKRVQALQELYTLENLGIANSLQEVFSIAGTACKRFLALLGLTWTVWVGA